MTDAGHPSRHGYVRCDACGCWRRASEVAEDGWCRDMALCKRLLHGHALAVVGEQLRQDDVFRAWCHSPASSEFFSAWAMAVKSPETASHASIGDAVVSVVDSAGIAKAGQ